MRQIYPEAMKTPLKTEKGKYMGLIREKNITDFLSGLSKRSGSDSVRGKLEKFLTSPKIHYSAVILSVKKYMADDKYLWMP